MNTDYLESFTRVVECNSLAEAARRLRITPGAVAARIRILEEELGVALIQRSGATVKPTEAGLRIYDRALDLLQNERDLKAVAATGSIEGEIQLGAFPSGLTTHLPALLEPFCSRHPEISVQVQYDASDALCGKVHAGQLDAALVIGGKKVIYNALMSSVEAGTEVIVPAPYWVSYPDIVLLAGGTPVIVPCSVEHGFKLQPSDLERAITPNTRWLVLNAPNNPCGAVYTREE